MSSESLELEPSRGGLEQARDERKHMPEPPPVRLTAVEDVHLPATTGMAPELDAFYVDLLRFEREPAEAEIVYRAENFRLHLDVQRPPVDREDFRPIFIEVPDLNEIERKLIELETEYERQRGLSPGRDQLVLRDPAGNWVSIGEMREVR